MKSLLQANIPVSQSVDLTLIKQDAESPPPQPVFHEKSTQTDIPAASNVKREPVCSPAAEVTPSDIKKENYDSDGFASQDLPSGM